MPFNLAKFVSSTAGPKLPLAAAIACVMTVGLSSALLADEIPTPAQLSDSQEETTVILPSAKRTEVVVPGESSKIRDADIKKAKSHVKTRGNAPCMAWIDPDVQPRAVLLCVHGLGLHNGTYADFGQTMSKRGFATYAIDVRGFGSWMEAKGREQVNFDGCMDDVRNTLLAIHKANPRLPVFILGESMGGAIALRAAALYPELVSGLISSVPAGDRFQQKKTSLKVALHLLEAPNKPFDVGTGIINQATQNQELRDTWANDPLARMKLSPIELMQFQQFMNQNHESAQLITSAPVLIVQGCEDRLVKPQGTVELYNELATPDRELVLVHKSEHLIFEENQFSKGIIDLVVKWIDARLPKTTAISDGHS